jgi:2-phosphoglycerate kinase
MRKIKELVEKANSHGRHRYFYRDIRNHARPRLILVGAPTQWVAYVSVKHHG